MDETVCVVGIGYVGLPLAVAFDEEGYTAVGFDIDERKVRTLRDGIDPTDSVGDDTVAESGVAFTADPRRIGDADSVIIAVPTPIDESNRPDLSFVESAGRTVGEQLSPGTLVVLESTVYPGATEEVLLPTLEEASGYACGEEFEVAYSPERATGGNSDRTLRNVVKIISARNDDALQRLRGLYGNIVDAGVHVAPDIQTAEAAKCAENIQRDVNIALVNEFAMALDRLGLDTGDVIEAAATKWNFHRYTPGLVGGHCIPVDPYYLIHKVEREGYSPDLMSAGRKVNESVPRHVGELTIKGLNACGNVLKESSVLVLGLTYKPDASDIRTAAAGDVIDALREYDIDVTGYDPYASNDVIAAQFDINAQTDLSFGGFDAVLLATPHSQFRALDVEAMAEEMNDQPLLVDVKGAIDADRASESGFEYRRL